MLDHFSDVPFFDQLSENVRNCLLKKACTRDFRRGETITLQGERADCLKVVLSGWVKLFRISINGEEAIFSTLHAGQSFDELAALKGGESASCADAITDCRVLMIDLSSLCTCSGALQEITNAVLLATSDHMESLMHDVETLKVQTGAERLAHYLLTLSGVEHGPTSFQLPYGKVVLAGMLGMKPESLSRAFARLKTVGVESRKGRVTIHDIARFRALATEVGVSV